MNHHLKIEIIPRTLKTEKNRQIRLKVLAFSNPNQQLFKTDDFKMKSNVGSQIFSLCAFAGKHQLYARPMQVLLGDCGARILLRTKKTGFRVASYSYAGQFCCYTDTYRLTCS